MDDKGLLALTLHKDKTTAVIELPDGRTVEVALVKHKGSYQSVVIFSAPKDIIINRGDRKDFHK